MKVIPEMPRAR